LPAPNSGPTCRRACKPLYTLHGDEPLLVQEAADAIRATARAQGYTERTVHTAAGAHFDWSAVLAAGGSLSLFADKQIVEIRIPSGKPGKDGSAALQHLAEAAPGNDSTLTLVLLPRLDKMTRTGAWFSALENNGVDASRSTRSSATRCRNGSRSAWASKASA
jgi:DNA polymerase-3 subunit delta